MLTDLLKGLIVLGLIFIPLERAWPLHRQPTWRTGCLVDLSHYIVGYFIGRGATFCSTMIALYLFHQVQIAEVRSWVGRQPVVLQLLAAMFIGEVGYYIAHRLLHTVPWLWRFHVVHHSVEQMDWLAAVRVHPVEQVLTKLFQMLPLYWLGFSAQTFAAYALYSAAIAFFIHANLHLPVGWWSWLVATPQFHHWHHNDHPKTHHKNFAAQLPIVDWLLGTFYLPKHKIPRRYGISERVPSSYWGQLAYPFQSKHS